MMVAIDLDFVHLFSLRFHLFCFFFNDTATTEIYTLSLHDALPICIWPSRCAIAPISNAPPKSASMLSVECGTAEWRSDIDRKSTRLNSSHLVISYAVFCLKKKRKLFLTVCSYFTTTTCLCDESTRQ